MARCGALGFGGARCNRDRVVDGSSRSGRRVQVRYWSTVGTEVDTTLDRVAVDDLRTIAQAHRDLEEQGTAAGAVGREGRAQVVLRALRVDPPE